MQKKKIEHAVNYVKPTKVMTGGMYEAGEKKGKGITQNRWRKTQQEKKRKIEEDIDLTELCQWSATQTLGSYYRHWQDCIYQLLEMITLAFHKNERVLQGLPSMMDAAHLLLFPSLCVRFCFLWQIKCRVVSVPISAFLSHLSEHLVTQIQQDHH